MTLTPEGLARCRAKIKIANVTIGAHRPGHIKSASKWPTVVVGQRETMNSTAVSNDLNDAKRTRTR